MHEQTIPIEIKATLDYTEHFQQYLHKHSNHPKTIIGNIPININKRLITLLSSKQKFDKKKQTYQDTLKQSGYNHQL